MLTPNDKHFTVRKNMRNLKSTAQETPRSRRKSLGPNHKLSNQKEDGKGLVHYSRKIIKTVRRSLAPSDADMIRFRAEAEKEPIYVNSENVYEEFKPVETPEARATREAREARQAELRMQMGITAPCMQFDEATCPDMAEYRRLLPSTDVDMATIGGMIVLHQYSYKEHMFSNFPVHRDGANFFKNADALCFSKETLAPIHMAYLGLGSIEKIAFWYRDHFSSRDLNRHDIKGLYNEDMYTRYDQLFDNVGRDGCEMMIQIMKRMESYCAKKLEYTGMEEYELGVQFWRNVSPLHLPRNYQLALILCKQKKWNHEDVEKWFRMLYTKKSWLGARGFDVYHKNPETQV